MYHLNVIFILIIVGLWYFLRDVEFVRNDGNNKNIIYIKNSENTGFGRPHNQAMRIAKGEFILLLNSDAILTKNYVEEVLELFKDSKVGSVQGKLLRYDFDKNELCKDKNNSELNIIDTTGLMILKNRRIVCVGQGQADDGQFEKETEIFGVDEIQKRLRKFLINNPKIKVFKYRGSTNPVIFFNNQGVRKIV